MIQIIAGTNRANSNALRVANVIKSHYDALGAEAQVYCLSQMPAEIFNPQSYAKKPESWLPVQEMVLKASGLHIVVPEYNGSYPGVLKYFIDMLKFPESFESKPVAFVGEAAGVWGSLRSVEQLQGVFGYRNAHSLPDRVFIPGVGKVFDDSGKITSSEINDRLQKQADAFVKFIKKLKG